ncbi:MAG: DUF5615 family PIN-like protein [Candidatus Omnitrophica bacterium]|nr:DUF5615 family PIN-like protein [Candidatus Omnitrophota bacterium]
MKFLLDENIPGDTASFLRRAGHHVLRCAPRSSDSDLLARADAEGALLLTRDHDFLAVRPSARSGIIYLRIHPSLAEDITQAVRQLISATSEAALHGHVAILTRIGLELLPESR